MRKIISLFQRNYETDHLVRNEVVPGAEWVLEGEGVATVKWDGTPVMYDGRSWFKRYDVKSGRAEPLGFIPAQDPDPVTGHWPGWVPIGQGPEDQWLREAIEDRKREVNPFYLPKAGETFEAVGPKIQSNPYGLGAHQLLLHGEAVLDEDTPRTFAELKAYFEGHPKTEGIVWHHRDGRMVKIKRRDFGLPWPVKEQRT
jgi:hypothetical protein